MNSLWNEIKLVQLKKILNRINRLAPEMKRMTDSQLQSQTGRLRIQLERGKSEDDIMPAAFASMREAMRRVLGIYLFDVQILGAIALYQGKIAEMKTGEGKTFTAVLPIYMNALTGRSTILVTTNEYLAVRDGKLLGPLYEWMGIRFSAGVPEEPGTELTNDDKRAIYASDVVYTTNGALGFDYLIEHLCVYAEDRYLRPFDYVVIDEADSVLLDAAQTPLIVSGAPKVQSNLYDSADYFVRTLTAEDYDTEEKDVWLTDSGVEKAQRFFGIPDLYDGAHYEFVRHIMLALRAHFIFQKDRQYVVADDEVKLLDANTGRILEKTRLQAGMHQALEAKEGVSHTNVHRAMAFVTFQDFFRMFPRVAGMTGTAAGNTSEFMEIYGLDVIRIPTDKPVIRRDLKEECFTTLRAELSAALDWVTQLHRAGQPVLIVAESIGMTQIISELLLEMEIPHNVLNAHSIAKEAEVIAEAGRVRAVTVATSVAGRGTDIKLGEGAAQLGGLAVVGIGKLENRRLELQARGRSGRQGDPGVSRFFVSLEDRVVADYGRERLQKHTRQDRKIRSLWLKHGISHAQRISEDRERDARRSTLMYGESIRLQRENVYRERIRIQNIGLYNFNYYILMEEEIVDDFLDRTEDALTVQKVARFILDNITYQLERFPDEKDVKTREWAKAYIMDIAKKKLAEKLAQLDSETYRDKYFQVMMIKAVDESWIEEVDYLQQLKAVMEGRRFTQRNMTFDYHLEAYRSYERMRMWVRRRMLKNIFLGEISDEQEGELRITLP
ncbi:MAG: accessory Sec system translocase SecA2 [Clostridiales bacterium]|nr:accessory Sec system translocase SecA2 [Clostridiales bacterium]